MVVNKQLSKPCNASQVNQTTDRDDKAHDAIALQLVMYLLHYRFCLDNCISTTYWTLYNKLPCTAFSELIPA